MTAAFLLPLLFVAVITADDCGSAPSLNAPTTPVRRVHLDAPPDALSAAPRCDPAAPCVLVGAASAIVAAAAEANAFADGNTRVSALALARGLDGVGAHTHNQSEFPFWIESQARAFDGAPHESGRPYRWRRAAGLRTASAEDGDGDGFARALAAAADHQTERRWLYWSLPLEELAAAG